MGRSLMSQFAARLVRSSGRWSVEDVALADCELLGNIADLLREVRGDVRLVLLEQDDEYAAIVRLDHDDAPPAHDSAPFGDADLVDDLGTAAGELLALCAHEGTLPVDLLPAVCEKAGCGEAFEELRG